MFMKSIIASVLILAPGFASAATLQGSFYDTCGRAAYTNSSVSGGCDDAATTAPMDSLAKVETFLATNPTADATFTSSSISYNTLPPSYIPTVAGFLGPVDGLTLSDPTVAAKSFLGSILTFSGVVSFLDFNSGVVTSDDGFALYIDTAGDGIDSLDLVSSFGGLRPPHRQTFFDFNPGTAGNFEIFLVYYEGSNTQASLDITLNGSRISAVPLPAAGWLLIAGLGGLGAMRRRKAKS